MRDELYDRDYQDGRDALNDGIDALIAKVGSVFSALHRANFDAPWRDKHRDRTSIA